VVAYGVSVTCCGVGGDVGDGVGGTVSFEMALMRELQPVMLATMLWAMASATVSSEMALGDGFVK
jgi:hypothetical protein